MARGTALMVVASMIVIGVDAHAIRGNPQEVNPLPEQWNPLAMITGSHVLVNKKAGLSIRVLEADGSASVAENPTALFVVATNGGTSDLKQHIWRLPVGVERVKKVGASKCGVDIQAEVDSGGEPDAAQAIVTIRACFIRANDELDSRLLVSETK